MNDDYLWNKSGEPDKEVQALEELLGTLRYQPRELVVPRDVQMGRSRNVHRALAIAAALAFILAGLGVWRSLQRNQRDELKTQTSSPAAGVNDAAPVTGSAPAEVAQTHQHPSMVQQRSRRPMLDRRQRVARHSGNEMRLSPAEIAQAESAKQQLMLALRVTSAKLSLVQKRTQSTVPANLIRNQHKIG